MRFPESFLFGATLDAHAVEGRDFDSDWWRWEQRPSRIADGGTSERGADHLSRYRADLDLARKLGHNAVAVALSWPRIHPEEDRFDGKALDHYCRVFEYAREKGLTALGMLQQVTVPAWFASRGGWRAPDAPKRFEDYTKAVLARLGDTCGLWLPLCEPERWLTLACRERVWPGDLSRRGSYRLALAQMAAAQHLATRIIREHRASPKAGVSVRGAVVEPYDADSPWDFRVARREERRLNFRFMETVDELMKEGDPFDFIGLGYYGRIRARFAPFHFRGGFTLPLRESGEAGSADMTTPCFRGLEELLFEFSRFKKPLMITGMGIATEEDTERCRFLRDHGESLLRCMESLGDDLDLRAWFHASLLDGFEWRHGYTRRTGLVHVKHPGLERTPNESAWFFKDIIEHRCVRPGTARAFCGKGDA